MVKERDGCLSGCGRAINVASDSHRNRSDTPSGILLDAGYALRVAGPNEGDCAVEIAALRWDATLRLEPISHLGRPILHAEAELVGKENIGGDLPGLRRHFFSSDGVMV